MVVGLAIDGFAGLGRGFDVVEQLLALVVPGDGADGAYQAGEGNQVLPEHDEGVPELVEHDAAHITGLDAGWRSDR